MKSSFFDLDAPLWAWLTELADIMMLSLYWWICSIPLITIGASTSSLYYVLGKKMRKEPVYVTRDFFHSFKSNFKQSIPISIILLITGISGILYALMAFESVMANNTQGIMKLILPIAIVFIFEAFHIGTYVCALLARFHMKTINIFTTAFVLVHRHILTTGAITMSFVALVVIILKVPVIILLAPGIIAAINSYFIQKIFTKYLDNAATEKNQEDEEIEDDVLEDHQIKDDLE